ncbi:endonuclease [Bacteroidales bacterium OttesenSCG-928-L03]|nr:endonuclease [Bacteroidales bacterium OttesenSCG-928-L03]
MKQAKLFSLIICLGLTSPAFCEIPDGYYDSSFGKKKNVLKTAMKEIIYEHTQLTYKELWTAFISTDNKGNNVVWDMYSEGNSKEYTYHYTDDQCGNYNKEGDCYNREHSFPKSWFNNDYPMYTDLFHLYPTDGSVNGMRSNFPFGEVKTPTKTSLNGSKLGPCSYPGYTGTVFEPIDQFKGDFARTYFYMVTCYEDKISGWSSAMLDGKKYPGYTTWAINMLMEWSRKDPVSQKEINRNDSVYIIQGNRNPYIDYPQLAEYVWGDSVMFAFYPGKTPTLFDTPETITPTVYAWEGQVVIRDAEQGSQIRVYNPLGQLINQSLVQSTEFPVSLPENKLYILILSAPTGNTYSYKIIIQ